MGNELYTPIWTKHLPDLLDMFELFPAFSRIELSKADFLAAGDRQDYSFLLELRNGQVVNNISGSAVARDLAAVIAGSPDAQQRLHGKNLAIRLDQNFTLNITNE